MKKKKYKLIPGDWPEEAQVEKMVKKLSSPKVLGSVVLGPDAPLIDQFKWRLCAFIVHYKFEHELNQKEIAKLLGVDAPEANRLLHYRIERYTVDRLVGYVEILYPKLKLEAKTA